MNEKKLNVTPNLTVKEKYGANTYFINASTDTGLTKASERNVH